MSVIEQFITDKVFIDVCLIRMQKNPNYFETAQGYTLQGMLTAFKKFCVPLAQSLILPTDSLFLPHIEF